MVLHYSNLIIVDVTAVGMIIRVDKFQSSYLPELGAWCLDASLCISTIYEVPLVRAAVGSFHAKNDNKSTGNKVAHRPEEGLITWTACMLFMLYRSSLTILGWFLWSIANYVANQTKFNQTKTNTLFKTLSLLSSLPHLHDVATCHHTVFPGSGGREESSALC